ncbi:hypothetical protein ISCGN_017632, partial [Ixodes scapularis]
VGDVNLESVTHEDAVATLKNTGDQVVLTVVKSQPFSFIHHSLPPPPAPPVQETRLGTPPPVLGFNLDPRGFERVLEEMNIAPGSHQAKHASKATWGKIAKAKVRALSPSKVAHKRRKLEVIVPEQRSPDGAGVTYPPSGF